MEERVCSLADESTGSGGGGVPDANTTGGGHGNSQSNMVLVTRVLWFCCQLWQLHVEPRPPSPYSRV